MPSLEVQGKWKGNREARTGVGVRAPLEAGCGECQQEAEADFAPNQ